MYIRMRLKIVPSVINFRIAKKMTIIECTRGERPGEGDKVVGMQLHVYIHRAMCMCVW